MKKINWYIFIEIIKSCTLVFFIFTAISWLLQIPRLFSIMNNLQVDFIKIINLSFFIIPNLINIIMPFIVIFGLILSFIKLNKDKELIAMYSLGLSVRQILKPICLITALFITLSMMLNLFISPYIYNIYKVKEYNLRNIIDIKNINFSNFIELNDNLIIDFKKDGKKFTDIFINYTDDNGENIIFSNYGDIINENNKYIFNLNEGYKINIKKNEIEKLEFENYKIKFATQKNSKYNNYDKNTLTILELLAENDFKNIAEKIYDTIILFLIIVIFYKTLIQFNNFKLKNVSIFLTFCFIILVVHNTIKNIGLDINTLIFIYIFNILLILISILIIQYKNKYE